MEESDPVVRRPPRPVPPRRRRRLRYVIGGLAILAGAGVGVIWLTGIAVVSPSEDEPDGASVAPATDASTAGTALPSTTAAVPTTAVPTTAVPATTTTAVRDPLLGNGRQVTLAFAGDTNFEGVIAQRLAADPVSVFGSTTPVLAGADLTVVNMETAIGVGGSPAPKEFTFQAPPEALEAFRAAGVDVVSAANNHGMDFGLPSLVETLAAEQTSGFPIIGIGRDENEAYAPYVADVKGQRVAVIAATQVLDASLLDLWTAGPGKPGLASAKRVDRLVAEVEAARSSADTVVVFLHWGIEGETCPSTTQQELALRLTAAGADVIVGGHAHRVQGGGRMGTAVVHYGLGNFAFYSAGGEGARTGIFEVTITGRRVDGYEWVPARIVDRQPRVLTGAEAQEASDHWESLRGCTGLA